MVFFVIIRSFKINEKRSNINMISYIHFVTVGSSLSKLGLC